MTSNHPETSAVLREPSHSDLRRGDWVDRRLPAPLRPYARLARLDRPIGTWLLLFPCWWSVVLATPMTEFGIETVRLLVLFGFGAIFMRGAGCTYNDIVDRDVDARVERTRTRPIPSGLVSVRQAILFLVALLVLSLTVLLQFNETTVLLGVLSLALVFTYPLMKRVIHWPQAVLGLAFNWGALMGYTAVTGTLASAALALYVGGIFWTLGYDTIYAHQDKEDDALIGIKSLALHLGARTRPWLSLFYAGATASFAFAGWFAELGVGFYLGVAAGALHLARQVATVDLDSPSHCLKVFRSNREFGFILLAAVALGQATVSI